MPNSKIFVRKESVLSKGLQSRLRKVLRRVLLPFVSKRQLKLVEIMTFFAVSTDGNKK